MDETKDQEIRTLIAKLDNDEAIDEDGKKIVRDSKLSDDQINDLIADIELTTKSMKSSKEDEDESPEDQDKLPTI